MDDRHRILVIGGGVIGLTAAAALLARARGLSVTVLEKARVGGGASGYAGALDIPYVRTAFQRELVEASWAWHEARGAEASEYRRPVPMTWYAEPDLDLSSHVITRLASGAAPGSSGWRAPTATRPFHGPCFVIDPSAWCRALAGELAQSGRATVVEHAEVVALEPGPRGQIRARCADGQCHAAAHAVLALGPWLPGWSDARSWAAHIGLRTKRVFGLNLEVDASAGPRAAAGWPSADIYLHPAPVGDEYRLSLRHDEWDVDPGAGHPMADQVLERAQVFLDEMLGPGRWRMTGHRVFVDSYTSEFQAIIAPCSAFGEDVTVATATHGSGVRMAPGIAERTARTVLGRLTQIGGAA